MDYYQHAGKPRVRRVRFSLTGELCWQAARPGIVYLFGEGLHFYSWADAIAYALNGADSADKEGA